MAVTILTKNPKAAKQRILVLVDVLIIFFILVVIHLAWYHFSFNNFSDAFVERFYLIITSAIVVYLVLFYIFDLYDVKTRFAVSGRFVRIIFSVFITASILMIFSFFLPRTFVIRNAILLQLPLVILAIYFWREIFFNYIFKKKKQSNLLIIGDDPLNLTIIDEIFQNEFIDYRVSCVIPGRDNGKIVDPDICIKYRDLICESEELEDVIREYQIDTVVFSFRKLKKFNEKLLHIRSKGIPIYDAMTFYQFISGRVPITNVEDATITIVSGRFPLSSFYLNIKRIIDIGLSVFGLIISAPFVILSAILIQLESPGPVFFRPERVGESGKLIKLLKLRTMRYERGKSKGPLFTQEYDERVTKVGAIVRKFGFDEFPQLFNVLYGDMSLIGPRPIEKIFMEDYTRKTPLYYLRTSVKPGISGWAQVNQVEYPNSERTQLVKLQYDLFYIAYASLFIDIVIILKTVKKFFRLGYDNRNRRKEMRIQAKEASAEAIPVNSDVEKSWGGASLGTFRNIGSH